MKTQNTIKFAGILGLSFITAWGCGAGTNTGDGSTTAGITVSALDQNFGALTEDPTLPEDEDTEEAVAEAEETEAPAEAPSEVDAQPTLPPELEADTRALYMLRLAWGNFPANPALSGSPVEYSGSVSLDEGVLLGVRGVRFERNKQGDAIVRPRTAKNSVSLESIITVASDGVYMLVAAKTDTAKLTITLGGTDAAAIQYEETIELAGLKELVKTEPSATANQEVRISLRRVAKAKVPNCASGTMMGRWVQKTKGAAERDFAKFGGFLLDDAGNRVGKFIGLAGLNKAGEPVAFAKFVARGKLVARAKGTYNAAAKTFSFTLHRGDEEIGTASGTYTEVSSESGYGEVTGSYSAGTSCETF